MSEGFNQKKDIFMNQYLSVKEYINNGEYNKLSEEEKSRYLYDYDKSQWYSSKHLDLSDDELNTYINMKLFDFLKKIDLKTNTIKNILMFWFILTLIGLSFILFAVLS